MVFARASTLRVGRGFWWVVSLMAAQLLAGAVRAEGTTHVPLAQLSAAERERARGLMDAGDAKMAQGDAQGALSAYQAADEIVGVPTTGIEVGRAQYALGSWVEARDTWVTVARYPKAQDEPAPFTQARIEAERLAIDLAERIPTVVLVVTPPLPEGFRVWLDDHALSVDLVGVPLRVNPGLHRLRASAPGYVTREVRVESVEKHQRSVSLTLQPEPSASPALQSSPSTEWAPSGPRQRSTTLMWTGFAVAAAGVTAGAATGIWAYERTALAYEQCDGSVCPEDVSDDIEQARLAGTISTVAFVVGGAGLALGIWQAVTLGTSPRMALPRAAPSQRLALLPTGTGARLVLSGRFP